MVQLWVNLPARSKLTEPAYQGITADRIPELMLPEGVGRARIIAGAHAGSAGPAHTFTPMNVWDLRLNAGPRLALELPQGHTAALFVLNGTLRFDGGEQVARAELAVMSREEALLTCEIVEDATVLLLSGEPLDEPIVGYGPFVMNTPQEIRQAIEDFRSGRFGRIEG